MEVTRNKILGLLVLVAIVISLRFIPLEIRNWFENMDENSTNGYTTKIMTSKILAMTLLGSVSILLGFVPLKLGNVFKDRNGNRKHDAVLSSLLCFGGGVLLATSLLHMLPEVHETFEEINLLSEGYEHIPMAEIIFMVGFFLVYFIEELVHNFCDPEKYVHNEDKDKELEQRGLKGRQMNKFDRNSNRNDDPILRNESLEHAECQSSEKIINDTQVLSTSYDTRLTIKALEQNKFLVLAKESSLLDSNHTSSQESLLEHETDVNFKSLNEKQILLRDFFAVLALSFHAVFEGLAIGLESDLTKIWILFAAVATHKYVISFCVGLELFNANTPKHLYATYIIVFSVMSMVGIAIGTTLTSGVAEESVPYAAMVGILQALAGGTILYVCVFEILEREKNKKNVSGMLQLLFVILGVVSLLTIEILAGDDH